jgi:hypothetical protein
MLFLLLLIGLSFVPGPVKGHLATIGTIHHFTHIVIFFIGFFVVGVRGGSVPKPGRLGLWLAVLEALLEPLQTAVYGNSLEYHDILDDASSSALGFLCGSQLSPLSNRYISAYIE